MTTANYQLPIANYQLPIFGLITPELFLTIVVCAFALWVLFVLLVDWLCVPPLPSLPSVKPFPRR